MCFLLIDFQMSNFLSVIYFYSHFLLNLPIYLSFYHNAEISTWSPHSSNPKSNYFFHFVSLGHSIIDNSKFQNMLLSFECYTKLSLYLRAF